MIGCHCEWMVPFQLKCWLNSTKIKPSVSFSLLSCKFSLFRPLCIAQVSSNVSTFVVKCFWKKKWNEFNKMSCEFHGIFPFLFKYHLAVYFFLANSVRTTHRRSQLTTFDAKIDECAHNSVFDTQFRTFLQMNRLETLRNRCKMGPVGTGCAAGRRQSPPLGARDDFEAMKICDKVE